MGCFSWLKAEKSTKVANILEDAPFKLLIPQEFGGGFIKDNYRGYGIISDGKHEYDMYELLAIWNLPQLIAKSFLEDPQHLDVIIFNVDNCTYSVQYDATTQTYGCLKVEFEASLVSNMSKQSLEQLLSRAIDLVSPTISPLKGNITPLKPTDKYTDHNRSLGISIGCYDNQIDKLKYPLKLVSASYKGTYEDCEGRSYGDPEQGWHQLSWSEADQYLANVRERRGDSFGQIDDVRINNVSIL